MRLTFLYRPVPDLAEAVRFHEDVLGLQEARREGESTVAFSLPEDTVQIMVSTDGGPAGPMCLVDDAAAWDAGHGDVEVVSSESILAGTVFTLTGAGGAFYVFDQTSGLWTTVFGRRGHGH